MGLAKADHDLGQTCVQPAAQAARAAYGQLALWIEGVRIAIERMVELSARLLLERLLQWRARRVERRDGDDCDGIAVEQRGAFEGLAQVRFEERHFVDQQHAPGASDVVVNGAQAEVSLVLREQRLEGIPLQLDVTLAKLRRVTVMNLVDLAREDTRHRLAVGGEWAPVPTGRSVAFDPVDLRCGEVPLQSAKLFLDDPTELGPDDG